MTLELLLSGLSLTAVAIAYWVMRGAKRERRQQLLGELAVLFQARKAQLADQQGRGRLLWERRRRLARKVEDAVIALMADEDPDDLIEEVSIHVGGRTVVEFHGSPQA